MLDEHHHTDIEILEEERDGLSKDIYGLFQIVDCVTGALQAAALVEEESVDWPYELATEIHFVRCKIQGVLGQFVTAYEEEDRISPPPSRVKIYP